MDLGKIGIITVLYKSKDFFLGFLDSLQMQDYNNYHLYCIDNDFNVEESEYYKDLLQKKIPLKSFTYLPQPKNIGVAAGNNIGIYKALADNCSFILLANNDIEFYQKNLLQELALLNKDYGIIAPKILYYNSKIIWYRGGHFGFFREVIHQNINKLDTYNDQPFLTQYAPTCFVIINEMVFKEIGFMDEKYFVYSDDSDFMYRGYKKNIKILCTPFHCIYHKVSQSTGINSPFSIYYGNRNTLYFRKKNTSFLNFYSYFFYMIFKSIIKSFYFNSKQNKSMWSGIFDFFKM